MKKQFLLSETIFYFAHKFLYKSFLHINIKIMLKWNLLKSVQKKEVAEWKKKN